VASACQAGCQFGQLASRWQAIHVPSKLNDSRPDEVAAHDRGVQRQPFEQRADHASREAVAGAYRIDDIGDRPCGHAAEAVDAGVVRPGGTQLDHDLPCAAIEIEAGDVAWGVEAGELSSSESPGRTWSLKFADSLRHAVMAFLDGHGRGHRLGSKETTQPAARASRARRKPVRASTRRAPG
jgi:hypothetical protein